MFRSLLFISIVGLANGCNNEGTKTTTSTDSNNTTMTTVSALTEEEQKDGWISLFDGQTTKGWHKYGGKPVGSSWKVVDGTLHLDASEKDNWQIRDGGDIVSDDEYDNFHFKLEWKIDTCGNSGVIIYIHEDSVKYKWPWMTGPEMQVLDNKCHPDSKIIKHRAGDLYDLISCSTETVKPAGEWNVAKIVTNKGHYEFWLNGVKTVEFTMHTPEWDQLVAGSKFKDMPDFGKFTKGRISLQDHGDQVWFRNIKIKELK